MKHHHHNHAPHEAPLIGPVLIVGCGRVGAELAESIWRKGVTVAVIDRDQAAFTRLPLNFGGRLVQGDALDRDALERAGIASAHALAAVTAADSANIVVARVARNIFHLPHVVARVYDPARISIYESLGIQTMASSSWGAQRVEQILLHPGLRTEFTAGNGEVEVLEVSVPEHWHGRSLADLLLADQAIAVALARGGRALLPGPDAILHSQDILHVSATAEGASALRRRLQPDGKA